MNKFNELLGKTLKDVSVIANSDTMEDRIYFTTIDDERYILYHSQECCEDVWIEDINGDVNDLVGSPILMAEVSTSDENPLHGNPELKGTKYEDRYIDRYKSGEHYLYSESHTWSFYKLATIKGYVTIRWYGTSNGYYSEEVDFKKEE